jgi:FixJ family two-component response regulator
MLKSIERLLNAHGLRTRGFSSAESSLGSDFDGAISCLVLDVHLADMSGIQLQRRLRDLGFAIPVIFITAVDDLALEVEARAAGCIAYLRKPFAPSSLLSAVSQTTA